METGIEIEEVFDRRTPQVPDTKTGFRTKKSPLILYLAPGAVFSRSLAILYEILVIAKDTKNR